MTLRHRGFEESVDRLRRQGLLRLLTERECGLPDHPANPGRILFGNRQFINFASNDYLGLSANPEVVRAAKKTLDACGAGAGASRLLGGGTTRHQRIEEETALFKGTESAIIFNSGYTANTSAIPALAGEGAVIFSDELNHASIIDGCRLSRAKKVVYRHRDTSHLKDLIAREGSVDRLIVTDSVFSMDGDLAPLDEIYEICRGALERGSCRTILYIDDAHGTGVLGHGRGALAHFGLLPEPWVVQMGTFSKALGSFGAFIAGERTIIEWLINACRGFIYSTALPPHVIAASARALALLAGDPELIGRLWRNRDRLYNGIVAAGYRTTPSASPIIPIVPPYPCIDNEEDPLAATLRLADHLLREGIYAPAIRPPTVTLPRIRFTVSAAHSEADIDLLLNILQRSA